MLSGTCRGRVWPVIPDKKVAVGRIAGMKGDRKQPALFECGGHFAADVEKDRASGSSEIRNDSDSAATFDNEEPIRFAGRTGDANRVEELKTAESICEPVAVRR